MPRPRINPTGATVPGGLIGAAVGLGLSLGPAGAIAGGLIGAIAGAPSPRPLSLEQAVSLLLAAQEFVLVSMSRRGPRGVDIAVRLGTRYDIIKVTAPPSIVGTIAIDDYLYDEFEKQLAAAVEARREIG